MSIRHALLGILADGPAHGYDIKRAHDARFPGVKPLAFGQVYATLARLERDDLIEVAETTRHSGPERTSYAITPRGEQELAAWLADPEPAGAAVADDLVRKTVTAVSTGADTGDFIQRQRSVHMARMRELTAMQQKSTDPAARIAVDHTLSHLDADLRWLENTAARVAAEGEGPA